MPVLAPHPSDFPELLVYPDLWSASLAAAPTSWTGQLRVLHILARAYQRDPGGHPPPAMLGRGEAMLLHALASLDPAEMIIAIATEFPHDPDPLRRLDPGPASGRARLRLVS